MSLWWLLLLEEEEEEAGEGRDGWGVLWAQQLLLHQGGLAALALLLLMARASCARLAAKAQATGSLITRRVWQWTTRATSL